MKRLCVVAAVAAVLGGVLISSAVAAQPPGGGRGGMGFGMFGGGGMISMLSIEQVQKELQETPDQVAKVKEVTDKLAADMREAFPRGGGGGQNLTDEERQARRQKMQEMNAAALKKVQGVLLAQQVERLQGVYLWVGGPNALVDPDIAKALKITEDQQTKIREIQRDAMSGMRDSMQGLSPEERTQKIQEARKATEEKVAGVLTADQKEQLTKMKGKEFKLDMTGMRRGGRRGGGGGGGGGPST